MQNRTNRMTLAGVVLLFLFVWGFSPGRALADPPAPTVPALLTVRAASSIALQVNPAVPRAVSGVEAAEAATSRASAPYYPVVGASVGVARVGVASFPDSGYPVGHGLLDNGVATSVTLQQTVADFGRRFNALRAARLRQDAAGNDLGQARQDVVLGVVEGYFGVLSAAFDVELAEDAMRQAEQRLKLTRAKEGTPRYQSDISRGRSDFNRAHVNLVNARAAELQSRVGLAYAMGLQLPVADAVAEPDLPQDDPTAQQAFEQALRSRPDLAASRERLDAAYANLQAASSEYYPTLGLAGGYNLKSSQGWPMNFNTWNAGIVLQLPVFTTPLLSAGVKDARATVLLAQSNEDATLLAIRSNIAASLVALHEARAQMIATREYAKMADESYRSASEAYARDIGSLLEASSAQNAWLDARRQETNARYQVHLATSRLRRAVGTLSPDQL